MIKKTTKDDLFKALDDSDFMWELYTAGKHRVDYHKKGLEKCKRDDRGEEYKKMMVYTHLARAIWKCLERF